MKFLIEKTSSDKLLVNYQSVDGKQKFKGGHEGIKKGVSLNNGHHSLSSSSDRILEKNENSAPYQRNIEKK